MEKRKWSYRASNDDIVEKVWEVVCLFEAELFATLKRVEKTGCFGVGKLTPPLLNIETTSDMSGLSSAFSWTHKRPIWMHNITSPSENESQAIV